MVFPGPMHNSRHWDECGSYKAPCIQLEEGGGGGGGNIALVLIIINVFIICMRRFARRKLYRVMVKGKEISTGGARIAL